MSGRLAGGPPRAVLLDLDGTLVDSALDLAETLDDLLAESGHPPLGRDRVATMIGAGVAALVQRGFAAHGVPLDEAATAARTSRFMELYTPRATRHTRPCAGVATALPALAEAGVPMAVCTNKPQAVSERILADLGLRGHVRAVVGGDCGLPKKPDPAILLRALALLGADPSDAVHVGDGRADMEAAKAAGTRAIFVEGGYAGPADREGAALVLSSFGDLPEALGLLDAGR
ncbi:HAD-IA family hydrolase [Faunimonas sp. B44]|uniref:HAD-IA family hydrolase n=1 Tax=Faunimonas sp. B44 TaxID=3461493 RepID=UPI004044055F